MWRIEFENKAFKDLAKLSAPDQKRVADFLDNRIVGRDDPKRLGAPLTGKFKGLWRYRIGDIRIIAKIEDSVCIVLVVEIGHRGQIYR